MFPLPAETKNKPQRGAVILELFTSQGCSSCPPADRLMNNIFREATDKNLSVYPLAFHVDYWNYLGWIDPFSLKEYSHRQRQYGKIYKWGTIFTPQVVANGQYSISGNDKEVIHKRINNLMDRPSPIKLQLKIGEEKNNKIVIQYVLDKFLDNLLLNLALVEHGLFIDITAGENAGLKANYDNVVRMFKSFPLKKKEGSFELPLDPKLNLDKTDIIGFVQDAELMFIFAADKVNLQK